MPEISRFLGIIITISYRDHRPPHFHAKYGVRMHLSEARSLFKTLRVPKYVERTEQLAHEFGVRLPEDPAQGAPA